MTEHDLPAEEREHLARRAVWDYLSVGPEPGFGDIEMEALDAWIEAASFRPESLRPQDVANLGWMHVERAWARVTTQGMLSRHVPDEIAEPVRADLAEASDLFGIAQINAPSPLRAHLLIAKVSLPIFKLALLGAKQDVVREHMAFYIRSQHEAIAAVYHDYKQTGAIHDVPLLNQLIGLRWANAHLLHSNYLALPAAYRHSNSGSSPYHQWHAAIFNRDNGETTKLALAAEGPPDFVLFPPELLLNHEFPSPHGRGTAEAMHITESWHKQRPPRPPKSAQMLAAEQHSYRIDELFHEVVMSQLANLQGELIEAPTAPEDPITWYRELLSSSEPCAQEFEGALEAGISMLELAAAEERITPEERYLLGWMHMEYGTSFLSRDTERTAILGASLERAEDVFAEAKNAQPERSSRYYEAAVAESAARMYKAVIVGEGTEEALEIYCGQLAIIAHELLQDYKKIGTKASPEADAMERLLQQITIYLIASTSPGYSHIGLPSSPRQRGSADERGWDFTLWANEGEDSYAPGQFYGRLETEEDPKSIDQRVITLSTKSLGQWTAAHDFRVLRTLISQVDPSLPQPKNFRKDYKTLSKATRNVLRIIDGGQD